MFSTEILRCGHESARPLELRAGPLTMRFEPDAAFLRHIRLGDHEVVRAIYATVRDENWATIPPEVILRGQEIGKDSFRLAFDVRCARGPVDYAWGGVITGDASGRVQFKFDGVANSDFQRNRIGICILHPIEECQGRPVTIEHPDAPPEQGTFPRDIAPWEPFTDIRALAYEVPNTGITARLEMTGDAFEMEDQRNWSDASFKTYCTPQSKQPRNPHPQPQPVPVKPGDRVQQSVTLTLGGKVRSILPVNLGRSPQLSIATTPVAALPPLGLCVASHGRPWSAREVGRLAALKLSHLRAHLRLNDPAWPAKLEQATTEANTLGAGLHLALTLGETAEKTLPELARHLERLKPRVLLWIILHDAENPASESTVQRVRPALQKFAPAALFAAATPDFFTEINRTRPEPGAAFSIGYSNNPQVHAYDNTTLVENLAGQVHNVETARTFTPRPVVVSPITLRIRNNARATHDLTGELTELPSDVDPRQLSLFAAGWTLASIAKLAATGFVHSLTYYETTGWRGLMETDLGSPLPAAFPSEPGMVFPLYHVFADIAEFGARQIYPTHSTHPLDAEGLTLFDVAGRRRILAANFTGAPQELKIKTGTCTARVRYLDETNAEEALRRPEEFRAQTGVAKESVSGKIELKMLPFAVARVDIG